MSEVSNTHLDEEYEKYCRDIMADVLLKSFNILVSEPESGYSRSFSEQDLKKFSLSRLLWQQKFKGSSSAQVDFWGHTTDIKKIPRCNKLDVEDYDGEVIVSSSKLYFGFEDKASSTIRSVHLSPEKSSDASSTVNVKYILGEITQGGRSNIESKLTQLEKACTLALMKSSETIILDVLDVVAIIFVVVATDCYDSFAGMIIKQSTKFPFVCTLFKAGRFVFVLNKLTAVKKIVKSLNSLEQNVSNLSENLTFVENLVNALNDKIDTSVSNLNHQMNALNDKIDTSVSNLNHQMNALNDKIDTSVNNLNQQVKESMDEMKLLLINLVNVNK